MWLHQTGHISIKLLKRPERGYYDKPSQTKIQCRI
jgi:hypothetical protein